MKCPSCGGTRLEWGFGSYPTRGSGNVQDGRFKVGEVETVFFLACEECSELVRNVYPEDIVRFFNGGRFIVPVGA